MRLYCGSTSFFVYFSKTNPVLPDNPLDLESRWLCRNCGLDVCGGQEVASMERSITVEWESICNTTDLASMEAFILKHKSTLHPNHAQLMGRSTLQTLFCLLG